MLPVSTAPTPASTRRPNSRTVTARPRPLVPAPAASVAHAPDGARDGMRRMPPPQDDRCEPPSDGDERTVLVGWLEFHRATLARKCAGLTDAQLRTCAVPPSTLSLIGLVRHLTEIERLYVRHGFAGEPLSALLYVTDSEPDGDFDLLD